MIILHGENTVLSRLKLQEKVNEFHQKTKGEIISFSADKISLTDLKQALESISLLNDQRLIVVENLFSGRKSIHKEKIIDYLKQSQADNLIIWEGKKIDGRTLTSFKAQVLFFDISPLVFKFLDSLMPGNEKNMLLLFHQTIKQMPVEMLFFMLVKHWRLLIIAHDLGPEGLKNMQPWRQTRIVEQAQRFKLNKLLMIYKKMLAIDYQQKTGQTPLSLICQLDLLLASL